MCGHQVVLINVLLLLKVSLGGHSGRLIAGVDNMSELFGFPWEAILQSHLQLKFDNVLSAIRSVRSAFLTRQIDAETCVLCQSMALMQVSC